MGIAKPIPEDIGEYLALCTESPSGLCWVKSPSRNVRAGTAAFTSRTRYFVGGFRGHMYPAHRVVWFLHHGNTDKVLDHINGDCFDNRIENLREADGKLNAQNKVVGGAYLYRGRWRARIFTSGKRLSLGSFDTEGEANAAYLSAKRVYHAGLVEARYV